MSISSGSNGKGDKPRNCFSKQWRTNFDEIEWGHASFKPYWMSSMCQKADPYEGCPACGAETPEECHGQEEKE
jgi:hypothetical protein